MIAAATIMQSLGEKGVIPPDGASAWCEQFLSTNRSDRTLLCSVKSSLGRKFWRRLETICLPGVVSHWMKRKREIDRLACDAASEGFTQLVVLGTGLDTLAFRRDHERTFARVIAADHPATLAVIRTALKVNASSQSQTRVELLELDLQSADTQSLLPKSSLFDSSSPTLIVIEGVLMYLPERTVEQIFKSIAEFPNPRVRLIASWMLAEPGQEIGFRGQSGLVGGWLRRRKEPMLWGSTPPILQAMLRDTGWNSQIIDLSKSASHPSDAGHGLASEQLVIANR
jgi:methyltransferase (TIGR00027 family)